MVLRAILGGMLALSTSVGVAQAMPTNMLIDGSFESGLAGWTTSGSGNPGVGAVIIPTDGSSQAPFGDIVPSDPIALGSTDPGGVKAAYFYDDSANDTLTQNVLLSAGSVYFVGFDLFKTSSGAGNPQPFTITGSLGSNVIATATSGSLATASWTHYSGQITALFSGLTSFSFLFTSPAGTGQDVVVDRVYVVAVPEPASLAMLAIGLAALAAIRRRA